MVEVVPEVRIFTDREAAILTDVLQHAFECCIIDGTLEYEEAELFQELIDALDRSDGIDIVED